MQSTNTTQTSTQSNPHFFRAERAPYELGYLLQKLPRDFNSYSPATTDDLLIATAAARHADNALDTIMRGLESIGACLFSAVNDADSLDNRHVRGISELIQHLSVEAQFLREKSIDLTFIVTAQTARLAATGKRGK
jgi:hypothetical protein